MQLHAEVSALSARCRELRRALPQIPATCYTEYKTQTFLLEALANCAPDRLGTCADMVV